MFVAFKVGVTAFKAGKIAVNTKEVFGQLRYVITDWEAQLKYYNDYFHRVHDVIPITLYALCQARVKVVETYLEKLQERIAKAEGGEKKAKAMLIGKSSGEMGTTFEDDIMNFWYQLNEAHQFCESHIQYSQLKQMEALSEQLKALGQPGLKLDHLAFHSEPMGGAVKSKRFIFATEFPLSKVQVGDQVPIKWVIAGEIPHVNIEIQVRSMSEIAQNKGKKKYVCIATNVENTFINGEYVWTIPTNFVKEHSQHGNYSFRLTYIGKDEPDYAKLKAHSDTFKIKDASIPKNKTMSKATDAIKGANPFAKKDKDVPATPPTAAPAHDIPSETSHSAHDSASSASPARASTSTSASTSASASVAPPVPEKPKEEKKGGVSGAASSVGGAFNKAGGLLKKKF